MPAPAGLTSSALAWAPRGANRARCGRRGGPRIYSSSASGPYMAKKASRPLSKNASRLSISLPRSASAISPPNPRDRAIGTRGAAVAGRPLGLGEFLGARFADGMSRDVRAAGGADRRGDPQGSFSICPIRPPIHSVQQSSPPYFSSAVHCFTRLSKSRCAPCPNGRSERSCAAGPSASYGAPADVSSGPTMPPPTTAACRAVRGGRARWMSSGVSSLTFAAMP